MSSTMTTQPVWKRPAWQRAIALLLVLVLLAPGCAQSTHRSDSFDKPGVLVGASEPSSSDAWADSEIDNLSPLDTDADDATKVRHRRSGRGARIAAVSVLLGVLVIVDVLLLPAYHRRHDCFPCCRTVIVYVD